MFFFYNFFLFILPHQRRKSTPGCSGEAETRRVALSLELRSRQGTFTYPPQEVERVVSGRRLTAATRGKYRARGTSTFVECDGDETVRIYSVYDGIYFMAGEKQ